MAAVDLERHLQTADPEDTERLGFQLGVAAPAGGLLGLIGELGAGKTCLVRGLAAGLGADPTVVHSPSFTIATAYEGGRLPLAHVDLYRLERSQLDELFFRDILFGSGVSAVEWFDRLGEGFSSEALVAELTHASRGRAVRLRAYGTKHARWLAAALAGRNA